AGRRFDRVEAGRTRRGHDARMWREGLQHGESRRRAIAEGVEHIAEAFGRRECQRVRLATLEERRQARSAASRRLAAIARDVLDVCAALAQRIAEDRATFVAAEDDHALAGDVVQVREREQALA